MKSLMNKATTAISGLVMFLVACAMAGLGFALIGMLAFFAIVAVGLALVASPFVATPNDEDTAKTDAEQATV